jgi:enoyl-CoA hydratase
MLFESPHIRITAEHGTATLWLCFPGEPANALDLDRLRELDAALAAIENNPSIRVLVLRSGLPTGFCAGLRPEVIRSFDHEADAAAFSGIGQRVTDRLAKFPAATLAFIDGACLGAGLELALACDYRLALASLEAPIGFAKQAACLGGSARLTRLVGAKRAREFMHADDVFSAREANQIGLVDHAFCERRAKIELRSFLDRLERNPRKRRNGADACEGFAAERQSFSRFVVAAKSVSRGDFVIPPMCNPISPQPGVIAFCGDHPEYRSLASEFAMRGHHVAFLASGSLDAETIHTVQARGFLTPLEADQARGRIRTVTGFEDIREAGLVFSPDWTTAERAETFVRPRCVIAIADTPILGAMPSAWRGHAPPWETQDMPTQSRGHGTLHPRRFVGICFESHKNLLVTPTPETDNDTLATIATWLRPLGFCVQIEPRQWQSHTSPPCPSSLRPVAA